MSTVLSQLSRMQVKVASNLRCSCSCERLTSFLAVSRLGAVGYGDTS